LNPDAVDIFRAFQTGSQSCCTIVIIYFLRVQRPDSGGDHPLPSSVALRMGLSYSYASPLSGIGMSRGDLILVGGVIYYDSVSCISVSLPNIQNFGGITFRDILIKVNLIRFPFTSKSHF